MSTAGQRPLGAMYASAKTPDGYEVDSAGVMRQTGADQTAAQGPSVNQAQSGAQEAPVVSPLVIP